MGFTVSRLSAQALPDEVIRRLQAKILSRRLAMNPDLDPANDTSLDPTPDLLAALSLYPKRAEPLMVLSRYSEWLRDHWCASNHPSPPDCTGTL